MFIFQVRAGIKKGEEGEEQKRAGEGDKQIEKATMQPQKGKGGEGPKPAEEKPEQVKVYSYERNSSCPEPMFTPTRLTDKPEEMKSCVLNKDGTPIYNAEYYNISDDDARTMLTNLGLSTDLANYWLEGMKRVVGEKNHYAYWAVAFATNLWYNSAKGDKEWWSEKFIHYFDDMFSEEELKKIAPGKTYKPSKAGMKELKEGLRLVYGYEPAPSPQISGLTLYTPTNIASLEPAQIPLHRKIKPDIENIQSGLVSHSKINKSNYKNDVHQTIFYRAGTTDSNGQIVYLYYDPFVWSLDEKNNIKQMKNAEYYYNVDYNSFIVFCELIFGEENGERIGESIYNGVCNYLEIDQTNENLKNFGAANAVEGLIGKTIYTADGKSYKIQDDADAKQIVASLNPSYFALQIMVNVFYSYVITGDVSLIDDLPGFETNPKPLLEKLELTGIKDRYNVFKQLRVVDESEKTTQIEKGGVPFAQSQQIMSGYIEETQMQGNEIAMIEYLLLVLRASKNALNTETTQNVPKFNAWWRRTDLDEIGISPDAIVTMDKITADGQITPQEAYALLDHMPGKSFDEAIARLEEIRVQLIMQKIGSEWRYIEAPYVTTDTSQYDRDAIIKEYDTIQSLVSNIEKQDLLRFASILEMKESFWKKYFNPIKIALDYAKTKKPPAVQRFIRVLSENVKDLDQMAKRLDLIIRTMDYSTSLIQFSQNMKNAGQVLTRTDLLNLGYDPKLFSAFVKTEKTGNVLKLNQNVVPTFIFFGVFELKKGRLVFTANGEKYFKEWCKENGYDPDKIKGEILKEFSSGVLSSAGQSFLEFALKKAMKDNGITEKDLETFRAVQARAKAARVLLAERAQELNRKIDELGAKRLILDTAYEKNFDIAMNNLRGIST